MKIQADLHTHSIGSGHAYSTVAELTAAAANKGLKIMALTDHGPKMPDGPHEYYFYNLKALPKYMSGVRLVRGIEANIISVAGDIDFDLEQLVKWESNELVIASAHIVVTPENLSVAENTKMYINVMQNKRVKIIGHLENPQYLVDYRQVLGAAKETGTLIELNNASLTVARKGSKKNCIEIYKLIKEFKLMTVVNSDAHLADRVGQVDEALALAKEVGIKDDQILNFDYQKTAEYLGIAL
ncbi:phosphatase [bacterium]|nr:phosphatase [bacterium]